MFPVIKQLEERNVANEINILLWSHGMDLIAYSNVKGQYNNKDSYFLQLPVVSKG